MSTFDITVVSSVHADDKKRLSMRIVHDLVVKATYSFTYCLCGRVSNLYSALFIPIIAQVFLPSLDNEKSVIIKEMLSLFRFSSLFLSR